MIKKKNLICAFQIRVISLRSFVITLIRKNAIKLSKKLRMSNYQIILLILKPHFPSTSLIFLKSFVGEAGFSIYANPFSTMSCL
jgi:hypothetical protein